MFDAEKKIDRKGKQKMIEVDVEPRIHWYPREHCITRFPYGIAFPQGCESPGYKEDFSWYLEDLQHNVEMKIEEYLQEDGPPGIVQEFLMDSPVERLCQHFNQPKPAPINQDTSNPFADLGVEVGIGSSRQHAPDKIGHRSTRESRGIESCYVTGTPMSSEHPQMGSREHWVLYAFHPKFGPFEVHEGVDVVADRFLVSGLSRVRFWSITLDAEERFMVRQSAGRPWRNDEPMRFPVMDSLCPATGRIGREIFTGFENPDTDPAT
ncbi:hypothetical protein MKW92_007261, partial [Papaver armeniacum]